jgi:hypothetical protein
MQANVGDRIVIRGHRVGEPDRDCKVLVVLGEDGGPGSDASVVHYEKSSG